MNTTFTFRTDENLKTQASAIYKGLGLDLSTAINMFLKATVVKKKFPISVDDSEVMVDPVSTYPEYFFKLAGAAKGLGMEEPEDLPPTAEDFEL